MQGAQRGSAVPAGSACGSAPIPTAAVEQVVAILGAATAIDAPMRDWQISLDCGHRVAYRQHANLHAPDMPLMACGDCGQRRTTTGSAPVSEALERARRAEEALLELRRASEEVLQVRRRLDRAEQRLARARALLVGVNDDADTLGGAATAGRELDVVDDLAQHHPA